MKNHGFILSLRIVLLLSFSPVAVFSQVVSLKLNASVVVAENNSGSYQFQNLSNGRGAPDGQFVTATCGGVVGTLYSNTIIFKGFNLNLPPHAIISGISISIPKSTTDNYFLFGLYDHVVQLTLGSSRKGPNKASSSKWPMSLTNAVYNWSSHDLASLNPVVMNSPEFGIAFQIRSTGITDNHTSYVDGITLTVNYITSVLPAVLKSFDVTELNGKAFVQWKVEPDAPGENLLIEYSQDQNNWIKLYEEEITNNKPSGSFIHNNSGNGLNYYRLKLVRDDDVLWISQVKTFKTQTHKNHPFPNPVKDLLFLPQQVEKIAIYNMNGQTVSPPVSGRGAQMVIDFSALQPGIYFIKTENEVHRIIKK